MARQKQADVQTRLIDNLAKMDTQPFSQVETSPRLPRTGIGKLLLAGDAIEEAKSEASTANERATRLETELAALNAKVKHSREVDLNDLVIVPGRQRKLTAEAFGELKNNLANNPLASPVSVRELENGRLELLAGHNRVQAYRELGRACIPAVVLNISADEASRVAFYSNLIASQLPPYSRYVGLRNRQKESGFNMTQLSIEAGLSRAHISMLMSFDKLPAGAHELLEAADDVSKFTLEATREFAKASEDKAPLVIQLTQAILSDEITATVAIAKLNAKPKLANTNLASRQIRVGRLTACEIRHSGRNVNLGFKECSLITEELLAELQKVVSRFANLEYQKIVNSVN